MSQPTDLSDAALWERAEANTTCDGRLCEPQRHAHGPDCAVNTGFYGITTRDVLLLAVAAVGPWFCYRCHVWNPNSNDRCRVCGHK